ncbi:MAG: radical SAM protein [Proteobacteria bacterium]|nr:radical SAM protein [Pseudomonadota bacterium]
MQESPKSIYIKTFGCQMNVYDSDRMSGLLAHQGYALEKDIRKADVVLINTCSIRDKSEHKVLSLLGELKALKKTNPGKVLGITGCVGQRMGRTLLQKAPHLDIVMGPDAIDRVGNLVGTVLKKGERVLDVQFDADRKRTYSQPSIVYRAKPVEFLTIMKGCDHFCTYCIVPFTRGREKSRPIAEVIHDVKKFVAQGTKEITFLGQNINTYGKGTPENLSQLVEEADRVEGLERIRYIKYSPRPGTRAFAYGEEVPEPVKEQRLLQAQRLVHEILDRQNKQMIGKTTQVLVEALDKKAKNYTGRNPHGKLVHVFNAGEACVGKTIVVEITEATGSNLRGYYVDAPRTQRQIQALSPSSFL